MKVKTIQRLVKLANKEIETSPSMHNNNVTIHKVQLENKVLSWCTFEDYPNDAEALSVDGNGWSINNISINQIKSTLGI